MDKDSHEMIGGRGCMDILSHFHPPPPKKKRETNQIYIYMYIYILLIKNKLTILGPFLKFTMPWAFNGVSCI